MARPISSFLMFSLTASPAEAQSSELVGTYQLEMDASQVLELRGDGTAVMDGDETRWSVKGNQLTIGTDTVPYRLQGNRLMLAMSPGVEFVWIEAGQAKAGKTAQAQVGGGEGTPPAGETGSAKDEEAKRLLTSTAWCSFSFRSTGGSGSGVTETSRVVFSPDGTLVVDSGSENYSTGSNGTLASQGSNGAVMRWKVKDLRLYVDAGQGFQDVGLEAYMNSSGYPILKVQGKEYSMCK